MKSNSNSHKKRTQQDEPTLQRSCFDFFGGSVFVYYLGTVYFATSHLLCREIPDIGSYWEIDWKKVCKVNWVRPVWKSESI